MKFTNACTGDIGIETSYGEVVAQAFMRPGKGIDGLPFQRPWRLHNLQTGDMLTLGFAEVLNRMVRIAEECESKIRTRWET